MTREQGYIDFKIFKKAIDELITANPDYLTDQPVWLHHFGESLQHPEFAKLIRYAVDRGVKACLSINPIMLKPDVAFELIKSKLHMLYISLDGHDDESFYRIRGLKKAYQSSHDKVVDFLKLKKQHKSHTRIVLSMIDFQLNEDSITKTRDYWESFAEVDQFLLKSFSTWDGNASDVSELSKETEYSGDKKLSDKVECPFPFEQMTVLWNGTVVPCCNDYNGKLILGDLKKQTLSEIWNGQGMQSLRKEFISNTVKNPLCRHCDKLRVPREQIKW